MRQIVSHASLALVGASLAVFMIGCSCGASHERDLCEEPVGWTVPLGTCTAALEGMTVCDTGLLPHGATCAAGCWMEFAGGICGPLDGGEGRDAGPPRRDGSIFPATYYTLEPAEADTWVQHDRCEAIANSTVALEVTVHLYSSCDSPGPVDAIVDEAARTIRVSAQLWRAQGEVDCMPIGAAFGRVIVVGGLTPGVYSVGSDAGDFDLEVGPPPPAACTLETPVGVGEMCNGDCDCDTGLSCVAQRGDAVCSHTCQPLCERTGVAESGGTSCRSGTVCTDDPNFGSLCRAPSVDLCGPTSMCPLGMTCVSDADAASQCEWEIELNSATRHACTTNADCDAGLDCVEHRDPAGRRCEVRCVTAQMRCPGRAPHACDQRGVCEWLGE